MHNRPSNSIVDVKCLAYSLYLPAILLSLLILPYGFIDLLCTTRRLVSGTIPVMVGPFARDPQFS